MLILMQKDVWDKILDTFNKKTKSSVLGLFIAKKCFVSEKIFVSKTNFIPSPKVESSVLLFETHKNFEKIPDEKFLKIIKIWFSANRKKLIKNLEKWWYKKEKLEKIFEKLDIDNNSRAENLTIEKWCNLVENLKQ
jgi:16S rRNA (adenine1518-N6/adenine1519-N6)-dimethyltransferase